MRKQRQLGAAMLEAVIALPSMILVLGAAGYCHALIAAKQTTSMQAQRNAWAAAWNGCDTQRNADTSVSHGAASEHLPELLTSADTTADTSRSPLGGIESIPVIGPQLSGLAPRSIDATVSEPVSAPRGLSTLSNTASAASGSARVACNPVPTAPTDALYDALMPEILR
jgi:hypothetical protein